jgi:putative spermidine/putrescine transport system permease protein
MAEANAVILLIVTLMMIWGLTKLVDIRKEL